MKILLVFIGIFAPISLKSFTMDLPQDSKVTHTLWWPVCSSSYPPVRNWQLSIKNNFLKCGDVFQDALDHYADLPSRDSAQVRSVIREVGAVCIFSGDYSHSRQETFNLADIRSAGNYSIPDKDLIKRKDNELEELLKAKEYHKKLIICRLMDYFLDCKEHEKFIQEVDASAVHAEEKLKRRLLANRDELLKKLAENKEAEQKLKEMLEKK